MSHIQFLKEREKMEMLSDVTKNIIIIVLFVNNFQEL